jgi:hypothetical protein
MYLRGAALSLPLNPADARDAAAAQERCARCPNKRLCDEALASSDANSLSLFCPNSHYIQQVRSASLSFR